MTWLAHYWWLIFPAWLVAACIAGPLIGRRLRRRQHDCFEANRREAYWQGRREQR